LQRSFLLFFFSFLLDNFINHLLLSSLFILFHDFFFPFSFLFLFLSIHSLIFLSLFILLLKIVVSRFEPLIIDHVLFNNLVWSHSLFAHSTSRPSISSKFNPTCFLLVVSQSWVILRFYISWIRGVKFVSWVKRRLAFVVRVMVYVNFLPSVSLNQVRIDLSPVIRKYLIDILRVFDTILHVLLVLAFKSLLIPFRIRFEEPRVWLVVLIGCIVVSLCRMNFRAPSLQEAYAGVLFVKVLLVLKWNELTI